VKLVAQRFRYTPSEFRVKPGEVVLEFTSLDFVHGFNMPDLKVRADLPPGRVTQVRFTMDKPGEYEFLCDNFCGDQHEQMGARMIVEAG
jgi:cytochrome c oxidase subunit 2